MRVMVLRIEDVWGVRKCQDSIAIVVPSCRSVRGGESVGELNAEQKCSDSVGAQRRYERDSRWLVSGGSNSMTNYVLISHAGSRRRRYWVSRVLGGGRIGVVRLQRRDRWMIGRFRADGMERVYFRCEEDCIYLH
ncbi:hypothetical protein Tco_0977339 [Tanacetum coccineum]|uniref:Uncharacterized protein n=1 Tax=Tanacetum coccineum TaxID=301880 RepID=A0ABQ5EK20_9ASTR